MPIALTVARASRSRLVAPLPEPAEHKAPARDYETLPASSETYIYFSASMLMTRRPARTAAMGQTVRTPRQEQTLAA
ncbi:hypothetical protein ACHBTE_16100 [Streptomyces sp. M41]|uniref:hypothetical protein n=1 Tax=Streptomyces sp. M41 TaxID=3059412 RepID=UPI00374CE38D